MAGPPPKRCHTATTTEPFITDDYDAIAGKSVVDRRMWFVYCNIIYSAITLQLCVVGTDIATIGPNHNNNVLLQLVRCVFSFLGCTHTHTHTLCPIRWLVSGWHKHYPSQYFPIIAVRLWCSSFLYFDFYLVDNCTLRRPGGVAVVLMVLAVDKRQCEQMTRYSNLSSQ